MTLEEREATERRLIEINRRLGILAPLEIGDESPPELDAEEMNALYEERDLLMRSSEFSVHSFTPESTGRTGNVTVR